MSSKGAVLLPLPGFEPLAASLAGVELVQPRIERFENGELQIRLPAPVADRDCFLLGSSAPPAERLVVLLLAADTLVRNGARSLQALLPYLGYARQDLQQPGRSLAAAWLGRALEASGVAAVTTIDIHSERAGELVGLPVTSLSPAPLFARELDGVVTSNTVVVAPDEGALARAGAVARALGVGRPVAWLEKERRPAGVSHKQVVGELDRQAIVVDDILDTAGTLISCCGELRSRGVEAITVAVTHGLFTGWQWQELLPDLGVRAIHTTDSVPVARTMRSDVVRVHPIAPLLAEALASSAMSPQQYGLAASRPAAQL